MTELHKPDGDTLLRLYAQASAEDPRRPAPRVSDAIRAHARVVLAAGTGSAAPAPSPTRVAQASANHPRWKTLLLASIAVMGLAGMLFLQFDRGTPHEQDLVRGQMAPPASPAAVAKPHVGPSTPVAPPARDAAVERQKSPSERPARGNASPFDARGGAPSAAIASRPAAHGAPAGEAVSTLAEIALAGRVDALAATLAGGAAIDGRDADGRTPLMLAAMQGHREMVRRLLAAGADPRLRDHAGQTAAQLARAAGHAQLADLIGPGS